MPKILTTEEVKEKIKKEHEDIVSLDESSYVNTKTKCWFVDKDYGRWTALPQQVLQGHGHPTRGRKNSIEKQMMPIEEAKKKLKEVHGDIVVIDENNYNGIKNASTLIDRDFGSWEACLSDVLKGHGHPDRGRIKLSKAKKCPIENFKARLIKVHGDEITVKENTYDGTRKVCIFIDKDYGEFPAAPSDILKGSGHRKRMSERRRKTCKKKYGKEYAMQTPEVALKIIKSSAKRHIRFHWKTGEELICQASWEPMVVDYLNEKHIDYKWQPETFVLPSEVLKTPLGSSATYRPDLYLVDRGVWVEIKGLIREEFAIKWDWFKSEYPTAELWDKKKLLEMGISVKG